MLLAIVIANLIWIIPVCLGFGVAGYVLRTYIIRRLQNRIHELEREMLQNHAEILSLQKENAELSDKLKNNPVPVIPITGANPPKENMTENLPDVSARKKLLSSTSKKHS
jgi:hypothetical protein